METLPANFVDSRDFARIAKAIRYIDANFRLQPKLEEVAAHVNLSEFHFNRLFRRWAGITPKQYLAAVTGSAAREALAGQSSVLDAALTVGLSGPGRLHDLVVTVEAMTPGELKAQGEGTTVRYGFSNTPFGRAIVASTARGLSHLAFVDTGREAEALATLQATAPRAQFVRDDDEARSLALRIWSAKGRGEALRINVGGTNFQLKVWQALLELGARDHTSYGELADSIGAPSSTRAVAGAVGANSVAWLIPCHHVLRKGGGLGGYRWGEDRKRAMLAWEGLAASSSAERPRERGRVAARV
ncbi:MAG TPA: methylated-DNA--[protein]-cysteine S-methyltransferase [Steroidobacteraceae bacterium]|jgi:AraC family transcriptional regulator of adaptative response/methylated-DNA-[protein]-cysteine methyltransferase